MRVTLSESYRSRTRTGSGALVSVLIHAAVMAVAVTGTGYSNTTRQIEPALDTLIYTLPEPGPVPPVIRRGSGLRYSGDVPGLPPMADIVGPTIPAFDLGSMSSVASPSSSDFATTSASGRWAVAGPEREGVPFDATTVEKAVVPRAGSPVPRYPAFLATAGVEGSVVVRFVVDTLGRVEENSVVIIRSTHREFERAVRDAIPGMRFVPAEVRGGRVRQLVEQAFGFELKR